MNALSVLRVPSISSQPGRVGIWILGLYIFLAQVFVPLLSPFRATGELQPAEIRNFLLPPLLALLVVSCGGLGNVLRPRSILHVILIGAGIQAAVVGFENYIYPLARRDYFSHLFQISSAYIMLGVGWSIGSSISVRFWKALVWMTLGSVLISTFMTVDALDSGDISRYYTPAYALILVSAFAAIKDNKLSAFSILMALISNKRAVILSIFGMLLQAGIYKRWQGWFHSRLHPLDRFAVGVISLLVMGITFTALVLWAANPDNATTGLGRAANITYDRMIESIQVGTGPSTISDIDAARTDEVQAAYASLDPIEMVFGSGAGWSVHARGGLVVQNIHFTPLSLVAVFGAPFAIYLYWSLLSIIIRGTLTRNRRTTSLAERMAPLYLGAAVLHSLFAYSLFIDWLVFFFVGVLQASLREGAGSKHNALATV